ncbi:MAG: hypothetical protein OXI77_00095 [Chloroflexota bacterium]|nr:hypothetical protein [Chloroflexota bacterium]MDE2910490.1 hypothetical protein [Chloroflexota bacterium]
MDDTTLQVYSVVFVAITVVLVYTARYFQARRWRQRQLDGMKRIPQWITQSIESSRPLHLSFGNAGVGGDNTPVALAEAEFFHQVVRRAESCDMSPVVSLSAPTSLPLGQDVLRRAWLKGGALSRAQWYPPDLAYASAISALMADDEPAAHIMAGSFGAELALMLDSAARRGQPSLAVSDRLDGQAVAFAQADHVLIGEELFAAPGSSSQDGGGHGDAAVLDVWRALIISGATILLMLEFSKRLPLLSWPLVAIGVAILLLLGIFTVWRR